MKKDIVEFSVNKEDLFFGKYLIKIAIIGWLVVIIAESLCLYLINYTFKAPIVSLIIVLPIIVSACTLYYTSNRSKAKKIRFENSEEKLRIVLLLSNEELLYGMKDLNFVKVNAALSLVFLDGRKISFFVKRDFIQYLIDKNYDIKWGAFGNFYYKRVFDLN